MKFKATLAITLLIISMAVIPVADAISKGAEGLNCLACHSKKLGVHSQLGNKQYACQICHDEFIMKPHILNGTLVTNATISNLCDSCHHERYVDWTLGIHGRHGLNYTATSKIQSCVTCHDPHIPNIPEISPLPPPEPPERSTVTLIIFFPPALALLMGVVFVTVCFTRKNGDR